MSSVYFYRSDPSIVESESYTIELNYKDLHRYSLHEQRELELKANRMHLVVERLNDNRC